MTSGSGMRITWAQGAHGPSSRQDGKSPGGGVAADDMHVDAEGGGVLDVSRTGCSPVLGGRTAASRHRPAGMGDDERTGTVFPCDDQGLATS